MIQAKVLPSIIREFRGPYVASLGYSAKSGQLIITYCSDGNQDPDYEIVFEHTRGFKLLDEADLLNYWEVLWKAGLIPENGLFEIESGGWLDMEDAAGGFTSKLLGYREFLIRGGDDCVMVINSTVPEIRPL